LDATGSKQLVAPRVVLAELDVFAVGLLPPLEVHAAAPKSRQIPNSQETAVVVTAPLRMLCLLRFVIISVTPMVTIIHASAQGHIGTSESR
jgi:hypothetical protein